VRLNPGREEASINLPTRYFADREAFDDNFVTRTNTMKKWRASEISAFLLLAMLISQPAYAYIDPGMGSLVFQSAIAAFVAVGAAWAGFKMKILSFMEKHKKKNAGDTDASS
jgi:hypothetical protein